MSSILRVISYLVGARNIESVPDELESTPVPVPDLVSAPVPVSGDLDLTLVPLPDEPPLLMLPGEILQIISDFLAVSSASCLILCSRELLEALGNRSWRLLQSDDDQKKHFLKLLERDLSDWQLCHHCSRFHPIQQDEGPKTLWIPQETSECVRRNGYVEMTRSFKIRFEHAQLLMNQFRFGRAYNLQRLSNTYLHSYAGTALEVVTWPEIVAGELLIRRIAKLRLHCTWNIDSIRYRMPSPCHHLYHSYPYDVFWETILCRVSHANNKSCEKCDKWISCPKCASSFLVNILKHENSDIEIRVDVKKYLGFCETPFDSKWRQQKHPFTERSSQRKTYRSQILNVPQESFRLLDLDHSHGIGRLEKLRQSNSLPPPIQLGFPHIFTRKKVSMNRASNKKKVSSRNIGSSCNSEKDRTIRFNEKYQSVSYVHGILRK